jgi:methyl-branched lipid omega-hydroxylase
VNPNPVLALDEIDLSDLAFWARPLDDREAAFEALRRHRPVAHFEDPEPPPGVTVPVPLDGSGYYAVTRHADIVEASRDPELFCSGRGATSIFDMPTEFLEFFGSMINLDDPRHARLRRIVSAAFTPRMVKKIGDEVQRSASLIVDDVIEKGKCDFVTDVAAKLPLRIICNMMGVPEGDHDLVFRQSNVILGGMDSEYVPEGADVTMALLTAAQELTQLMEDLARHRAERPGDDVTSALVTANVDGEQLTHQELASFFILLAVAGNETTRNAISHGMRLLTEHPDQRAAWAGDFDALAPTAVEEIVRIASPVIFMRRTTTKDGTFGGTDLPEGAKLLLFYWSANRDMAVFEDPYRFDIRREPNPHVGFGGPGPHFCLGAHLARQEITVMFRELLGRVPDIHTTGDPERLLSNFINGIKHLPVAVV